MSDTEKPLDAIEIVYGYLVRRHAKAMHVGNEPLRLRIWATIELFYEFWPEETKRWEDRYTPKEDQP